MLAIRLPQSIEKRLEKLARRTGRTKTYYVREAILEHLEEIEDLYLAEGALERIRSGEERTIPLKQGAVARPGPRHPRTTPIAWRGKLQSLAARRYLPADTAAGSQRTC
jgi:RHH-type rel operon transcriptional repressor/antitoxin RelB